MPTTTVPAGRRTLAEIREYRITKRQALLESLDKRAKRVRNPQGKVAQEITSQRTSAIAEIEEQRRLERERIRRENAFRATMIERRKRQRGR